MPSNHFILCHRLFLLPSIFLSIRVFPNESVLHVRWTKYWSFSCTISPSNEYSGLISFRIAWFNLLAVQGTLKSLLQHHSSKASILLHSAFFIVQLSHPYMTTGKTIALTRRTFVSKVVSFLVYLKPMRVVSIRILLKCTHVSWKKHWYVIAWPYQAIYVMITGLDFTSKAPLSHSKIFFSC